MLVLDILADSRDDIDIDEAGARAPLPPAYLLPEVEALVPVVGQRLPPAPVAAVEARRAFCARQRPRGALGPRRGERREAVVAPLHEMIKGQLSAG